MKKVKNKHFIIAIAIFSVIAICIAIFFSTKTNKDLPSNSISNAINKHVSNQISANGIIVSRNEATLHFQIGGKLTYLPVKEGDTIYQGQTIALLDSYVLQKQLQLTANTYQTITNASDQVSEYQQAGVLEGQQRLSLDTTNKQSYQAIPETDVISDNVKKIVDNAILAKNSAQINVDIANYSMQLATLQSPITGTITHEDVNTTNTNITSTTSFTVADLNNLIFKANILEKDIDFISVGSEVKIKINGMGDKTIPGTIEKIYPQKKLSLSDLSSVYEVDIQSDELNKVGKYNQTGNVLIISNLNNNVILVPTWTVLSHQFIWVMEKNKPILKKIIIGKTHGSQIEILSGLLSFDRIITNPKEIPISNYMFL